MSEPPKDLIQSQDQVRVSWFFMFQICSVRRNRLCVTVSVYQTEPETPPECPKDLPFPSDRGNPPDPQLLSDPHLTPRVRCEELNPGRKERQKWLMVATEKSRGDKWMQKLKNIKAVFAISVMNPFLKMKLTIWEMRLAQTWAKLINRDTLLERVQHLNSSTRCLDNLPTKLLKNVFNSIETDVLNIVNVWLMSGTFPSFLKTVFFKKKAT